MASRQIVDIRAASAPSPLLSDQDTRPAKTLHTSTEDCQSYAKIPPQALAQPFREFLTLCSNPAYPVGLPDVRKVNNATVDIVMQRARTWDFGLPSHVTHKYLTLGLKIACTAYCHVASTPDIQADIATYSALCVMFDDAVMGIPSMRGFTERFCAGKPQLHPCLDRLAEIIRDVGKHFPPFGANAIVISTLDFINAELLLKDAAEMNLVPGSSNYIKYMRTKDGIDEAYAAFMYPSVAFPNSLAYIQAFPEIMECLHLINDILSHYKEMKAEDETTYVICHAKVHRKNNVEAVEDLVKHVGALMDRVREILGVGETLDAFYSVIAGFAQYHLNTERYQLRDIIPEYFPEV